MGRGLLLILHISNGISLIRLKFILATQVVMIQSMRVVDDMTTSDVHASHAPKR